MRPNVAWRARRGRVRSRSARVMRCASGPDIRTTPMPPRPWGVATATMVSVVENPWDNTRAPSRPFGGDDHRFQKRVADTFGRDRRVFRDREVDDAARVRVERANFLRHAGRLGLLHEELRHLA